MANQPPDNRAFKGQVKPNTGNPPPKGVTSKAGVPARDQGRDTTSKGTGSAGVDGRVARHNNRIGAGKTRRKGA